jgi:serine/threonine-protein kinase mTOR
LIKTFVKSNRDLSKSYANSILESLIQMIDQDQATSAFISAVLEAIGEISTVDADSVKPYMGDLLPLILECIKDQSSAQKREVAIKTLISIIENTGFVIKPYFFYPEILQFIRNLVQNEQSSSIKRLVFRLIGTIGALDPYLVKQIQIYYNASTDGSLDPGSEHSNIPPILRMIDQHHFLCSTNQDLTGKMFTG